VTASWLTERIENNRRAARQQPCPTCGIDVLVGPDDERCALTARVDLTPVTLLEEVVARLNGRHSYELIRGGLNHRDDFTIRARRDRYPILLDHECETAVLFS
jgi:hypothetical protein